MEILSFPTESNAVRIAELAERRLRESPYFFLRRLTCQFEAGVLTIEGRVPNGRLSLIAESIVGRVEGVDEIINRIAIVDPMRESLITTAVRTAG